jgi:hypothetical protein
MAGQYIVADATTTKQGNSAVGTSGAAANIKNYTIAGVIPPGIKLQQHVNHKVELVGSTTGADKFEMERIKELSTSCS